MSGSKGMSLRSIYGLAAIAFALAGCSSLAGAPTAGVPATGAGAPNSAHSLPLGTRPASGTQDLYIANIGGGVPLYSTGKNPQEVGDITDQLPRVTSVWVDPKGVLYAYSDNRQVPYETIEEFQPGASSPFFSLAVKRYGAFAVADSAQNVYANAENDSGQFVIDKYPPGSQNYSDEYVVPKIAQVSGPEGMAFDSNGALLVGVGSLFAKNKQGQAGQVFRLVSGTSTFVSLNLQNCYGGLIATDAAGNLYAGGGRVISVYAPGATIPSRIMHNKDTIVTLAVAPNGTVYADTYTGGITVYKPGRVTSENSFFPQAQVSGLALGPGLQ